MILVLSIAELCGEHKRDLGSAHAPNQTTSIHPLHESQGLSALFSVIGLIKKERKTLCSGATMAEDRYYFALHLPFAVPHALRNQNWLYF